MKNTRHIPLLLVSVFVLAVLVPSVGLGFLALRAAERESLYVERRLEETLLAEADLAARRVEELMERLTEELSDIVADGTGGVGRGPSVSFIR